MARGRVYTPYKRIVTALGLHQLDVYRVRSSDKEGSTIKDIIRIYSPTANKVALIDLKAPRESLTLSQFLDALVEGLHKNNISVPERVLKRLRQELASKEKASQQAEASG